MQTTHLQVKNIRCASCVSKIETALQEHGIHDANINFAARKVSFPNNSDAAVVASILKEIGYDTVAVNNEAEAAKQEKKQTQRKAANTLIALTLAIIFTVIDTSSLAPQLTTQHGQVAAVLIALVTLIAMVIAGGDYYLGFWRSLKARHATMDTLVALGTAAAWTFSSLVIITPTSFSTHNQALYFEAALWVLAFINFGQLIEHRATSRSDKALSALLNCQEKTATRMQADGTYHEVDVSSLVVGDHVRVAANSRIPIDGRIIRGESRVDESMLTGESKPIRKGRADTVSGGTINQAGVLIIEVTAIGEDTALSQIIAAVEKAKSIKPSLARIADKIAGIFVPIVILIAIFTAVYWYTTTHNASLTLVTSMCVLIIACPCALGLASPVSIMVASGHLASKGILIRSGAALEGTAKLTHVFFDKTGTLTLGKASITRIISTGEHDEDTLLRYAACVERDASHPIAQAIVHAAQEKKISLSQADDICSHTGQGITGTVSGQHIVIGNQRMMQAENIDTTALENMIQRCHERAETGILVAVDRRIAGLLCITDDLKPEALALIKRIQAMHISVSLLSGDTAATAKAVAKQLGINEVIAEVTPQLKCEAIIAKQAQGHSVAMVGDGTNDAPALQAADVGIAIGTGTDVAIEVADLVLMQDDLACISTVISSARATVRNIKQNFIGAFTYNTLAIPLAAGILYNHFHFLLNPAIASAAMAASSLTVVANALHLKRRWR